MLNTILITAILLFSTIAYGNTNEHIIHVEVCSLLNLLSVSEKLSQKHYSINTISVPTNIKSKSACQAIWIGAHVPLHNAKEVITNSILSGIELRYIGIHGDYDYVNPPEIINHTITIGASTKAAINQGLTKVGTAELNNIISANNIDDFHKRIRSTYSIISKRNWIHRLKY